MTSSKATPPKQMAQDHKWQTFIEFTLSSQSDSIHLATDLVVGTVQTLNWATAHLEQLKQALAAAIQNVLERSRLNNSGASLIVRVFISEGDEGPGEEPGQHQPSGEAAQQVRRSPAHGWGFFLVQKQESAPSILTPGPHHLIELFLYRESHRLFRR
jgi:hypothetical protein